jgi:hypothetical protein
MMKSTNERLAESYCRPQTEEEWKQVAGIMTLGKRFCHQKDAKSYWIEHLIGVVSDDIVPHDRTEIHASHFHDLLHDRIAPWRLEEDGFEHITNRIGGYVLQWGINDVSVLIVRFSNKEDNEPDVEIESEFGWTPFPGCKTYSQLLTLIQLIKYPK